MTCNAPSRKEYQASHYAENRERILARNRSHYQHHKKDKAIRVKDWQQKNKQKVKEYWRKHQKANRDKCLKSSREWYARNREAQKERSRQKNLAYYLKNRELLLDKNKAWRLKNPSYILAASQKRKALLRAATINLSQILNWIKDVKSKRFALCYYCRNRIPTSRIHFDHIVALAKGGSHSIENLCASCPSCNLSKQSKPVNIWIKTGQQFLML